MKAIIDRGWGMLNYALLEHQEVLKTKPVPLPNGSLSEVPSAHRLELVAHDLTNNNASITINVSKGVAEKPLM